MNNESRGKALTSDGWRQMTFGKGFSLTHDHININEDWLKNKMEGFMKGFAPMYDENYVGNDWETSGQEEVDKWYEKHEKKKATAIEICDHLHRVEELLHVCISALFANEPNDSKIPVAHVLFENLIPQIKQINTDVQCL